MSIDFGIDKVVVWRENSYTPVYVHTSRPASHGTAVDRLWGEEGAGVGEGGCGGGISVVVVEVLLKMVAFCFFKQKSRKTKWWKNGSNIQKQQQQHQ